MKMLVLALQRMGDLIMMAPTFRGLKQSYPQARLHVLINEECRAVCPLITDVDEWILLDRNLLQKSLGEADHSMLDAFLRVRKLITRLQGEGYEFALNLAHSRMSGWIAGLLDTELRAGLGLAADGRAFIASGWFRHLNDEPVRPAFHLADIFYHGAGLANSWHPIHLSETEKGMNEANLYIKEKPLILAQPFSSDKKKNWPLSRWAEALRLLSIFHPDHQILLLGSQEDQLRLAPLIEQLQRLRVGVRACSASLEATLTLCHKAKLLITSDTCVKHIASSTQCRILEISLGSSDASVTGTYSPDNLIIAAQLDCAPCRASSPCSQLSHLCAEQVSAECVALTAAKLIDRDFAQARIVAEQFRDQVHIYRTEWSEAGLWQAIPLSGPFDKARVSNWIHRTSLMLYLTGEHRKPLAPYGTHALHLSHTLKQIAPRRSRADWLQMLGEVELDLEKELSASATEDKAPFHKGLDFVQSRLHRERHESELARKNISLKIIRTLLLEMGK